MTLLQKKVEPIKLKYLILKNYLKKQLVSPQTPLNQINKQPPSNVFFSIKQPPISNEGSQMIDTKMSGLEESHKYLFCE